MPPIRQRLTEKQVGRLISLGTLIKQAFKLRVRRVNRWMANGFTRQEALQLSAMKSTNKWTGETRAIPIPTTRPYARAMLRQRAAILRQAKRDGITATEYRKRVYDYYKSNGWLTPDGKPDYWAEIRHYQRQTDYHRIGKHPPYDPSKPHKKKGGEGGIDYSHTRRQAKGYRAEGKLKATMPTRTPPDKDKLIQMARTGYRNATTPKKREVFEQWIRNLGERP